jgi:hypothetical protein
MRAVIRSNNKVKLKFFLRSHFHSHSVFKIPSTRTSYAGQVDWLFLCTKNLMTTGRTKSLKAVILNVILNLFQDLFRITA